MKKYTKITGRKVTAFACTGLLSAGLIWPFTSQAPVIKTVRAEEKTEKVQELLQDRDFVEGEVLVLTADSEAVASSFRGDDLLSQAEDLFAVDFGLDSSAAALAASGNGRKETEQAQVKGTIQYVKSSSMSTKELIEALNDDPRVIYAEPNYIAVPSGEENDENEAETSLQQDLSKTDSAENHLKAEKEEPAFDLMPSAKTKTEQEELQDLKSQAAAENEKELTSSSFGPSGYTQGKIPDMTEWQWGYWNNGNLAGTYSHSGTADIQYSGWNEQTQDQLPEYVVAVLDTGIDETHPDLAEVLWTGDIFGPGGDSHGYYSAASPGITSTAGLTRAHGSHVAGIIAGQWNGQGISGASPNVKLMSLRTDYSFASVLSCLAYAKEAARQGVNLIAVNNSWDLGSNPSNLINLAVTELGEMGVVSVFAAGNDSTENDQVLNTTTTLANNPYAVVVSAMAADGRKTGFSNYGVQTTDVMAPGSLILSSVLNQDENLSFMGEINAHAPVGSEARDNLVSYTSFDDQSVNPFESFEVYTDEKGNSWGSALNYPLEQPAAGTFDGTGALSVNTKEDGKASIVSSVMDLSGLETKPRYVSYRICAGQSNLYVCSTGIRIPVIYVGQNGEKTKEYKTIAPYSYFSDSPGNYSCFEFDLSDAETLTKEEEAKGITGSFIDWEQFSMVLNASCLPMNGSGPVTVYFDSISLGSCRYPYFYLDGTSMAAPAAAGVLSVIAGQHADSLGTPQTPGFAEKLAALIKGAAVTRPEYDQICATSGFVSVQGAKDPGPAISVIEDRQQTFTLTGYFMDQASVSLDGISCSYTVDSIENERFVLTVQKPEGYKGGTPVITVQGPNGKLDRSIVNISEASGKDTPGLYDHSRIPVPEAMESWMNYDLTGYNGLIHLYPRTDLGGVEACSSSIFAYDPRTGSWDEIQVPLQDLTLDGKQILKNLMDITACVKDGKLLLLLTGKTPSEKTVSLLVSMDTERNFELLGSGSSYFDFPAFGTLVSDGGDLYLAGGYVIKKPAAEYEQESSQIYRLDCDDSKQIKAVPAGEMTIPRLMPRISCSNGKMIISSSLQMDDKNYPFGVPADGVEQFLISQKEAKKIGLTTLVSDVPLQEYSSGALADGTFLLTGPVSKKGSADTYILNQDLTLKEYGKRVWSSNILKPASEAYNNAFYVLAKTAPSGTGLPSLVFSSTAVNAGIPAGDALIRPIVSKPARTGSGVPDFKNTDISVTWNDLVNNLKDQAQKAIDRINQVSEDSEVYLEVNRLAENDVQPAEKEAILNAASQEKMTENLFWMDIAMQLRIPGHEKLKLDENLTGTKATVKLPGFPEIQKGMTRSYQIFAYNPYGEDGKKAEVITPEFDAENQTLSFNLKNSSVYAIGYLDSKDSAPEPAPDPEPALTPSNSAAPANPSNSAMPSSSSSRTAAQTNPALWYTLAAVGALILAVTGMALRKK